ncbi:MAG TPA: hypothetical protein VK469_18795 [Candidatus Kapabacteria bacterium]|nr:hypothetical protein [Candidatus Kapabacteria bacterium]
MQIIREIRRIKEDRIEIAVPKEFKEKDVEILVFPLEVFNKKVRPKKKFNLTTYKCFGKKADFSRGDAYANEF